jgi:predicted DNA binding CopG/RHH family protein
MIRQRNTRLQGNVAIITVRVSPRLREKIQIEAKKEGLGLSTYLRKIARRGLK